MLQLADEATTTSVEVEAEGATTTTTGLDVGLDIGNIHKSPLMSHEAPVHEGYTSRSVEDNLQLKELMEIVPKQVNQIDDLEKELHQTKNTYGKAVLTLVERVKLLEMALKRKSKKMVVSDSEDFVTPTKIKVSASEEVQEEDISPTTLKAAKTLSKVAS
ncbi:hypothetical protein Tco_0736367 [Tanacetum coccineum]